MGNSTKYSPEVAEEICQRLAAGESLRAICRDEHVPVRTTVLAWVQTDKEGFATRYAVARDAGLDVLADELLEIADTPKSGIKTKTTATGKEVTEGDLL